MALGSELWRLSLADLSVAVVAPFGRGCPGVALAAEGRPLLGGAFTLQLDTGVAGALSATWFDRARTSIPFAGCEVLTLDGLGAVQGWADAHGQFRIPIHVPPLAGLVGLSLFSKGLALVPQLALANGVEVMIGSR
jgi:hypothetical protein